MKSTLTPEIITAVTTSLQQANLRFARDYPGANGTRQPVHTVYGGAHLFKADTIKKLGTIATRTLADYVADEIELAHIFGYDELLAQHIYARVKEKLAAEPIEDFRLDFEDGYGFRANDEEDAHAIEAAQQVAIAMTQNLLPPFFGLRIKALNQEMQARAIRTLDLFLTTLLTTTSGKLPANFVITLPKVVSAAQVEALVKMCAILAENFSLPTNSLKIELMIETPQAIINKNDASPISSFISAAQGRCKAIHFGAFDYTAACGISAAYQDIRHPACDFARQMMQAAIAGTEIWLADGVTTTLPIAPHRGENLMTPQRAENRTVIHRAWKIHYDNVRHSLASGFYQSWDLHPAQLIPRYAATYTFFLASMELSAERLRNFMAKAAQATTVGTTFDDAASGQGLLNYFLRALNCGAINEAEVQHLTSLSIKELQTGSFATILSTRRC